MACVICGASAAVLRGYGDWMVDKTESFTRLDMMKSWMGKWVCFQPWASNDFEVAYFLTKPYPTEVIIRVRLKFGGYPLVNSHITMGNHHAMKMGIHQLFLWPFSIANCKRLPGRVAQFMASPCGKSMGVTVMQTMGFELPWPSGLMLKLTGNWCHVHFHAKKSQLSS